MKFFKKRGSDSEDLPVPIQEVFRLRSQNMTNSQIVQYLQNEGYKSHEIFKSLKEAEKASNEKDFKELKDAPSDSLFTSLSKTPSEFQKENSFLSPEEDLSNSEKTEKDISKEYNKIMGDLSDQNNSQEDLSNKTPNIQNEIKDVFSEKTTDPKIEEVNEVSFSNDEKKPLGFENSLNNNFQSGPNNSFNIDEDIEKIEEIAESIVDEKWKDFMESVQKIIRWKDNTEKRMNVIEERFEDIKKSFDSMQAAVTKKIDVYDKNVAEVNTGVRAMEQVFQKVLPKLTDNVNELSRITKKIENKKSKKNSN